MNVFEIESDDHFHITDRRNKGLKDLVAGNIEDEILEKEKVKGRRIREPNKPCIFPDKLMIKFISGDLGN